jgi:hypothetical protein
MASTLHFKLHPIQVPYTSITKGHFLWLMALVDADYCFTVIDIGSYGSNSDGGIFSNSLLGQRQLAENQLNLPVPIDLPGASLLGKVNSIWFFCISLD